MEPGAYEEKYPKGEYFIIDVQAHFTNGAADRIPQHGIREEHGLQAEERRPRPTRSRTSSRKCSSTAKPRMVVISGVPGKEDQYDKDGKSLEGEARRPAWRQSAAQLGDVEAQEGHQRHGRRRPRLVPGQLCPQPLLGHEDQQPGQEGAVRADGARSQDVRHRLLEVVLPHRSGPQRQRLPARRREDDLSRSTRSRRSWGSSSSAFTRAFRPSRGRWATWPIRRTSRRPPWIIRI